MVGSLPNAVGKINRSLRHEFLSLQAGNINLRGSKGDNVDNNWSLRKVRDDNRSKDDRPPTKRFHAVLSYRVLEFT